MNFLKNNLINIKTWFINEWSIVVLALLVSLIYVLPYYITALSLGPDYRGMPLLVQDAEGEYLGQNQELQDGYYKLGSTVFYEYKDWPNLVPSVGNWFYYLPTFLFGMSTVAVSMLYKFLLPFVLFLLIYVFLKDATRDSRFWSIVGALTVVVGFDLPSIHFIEKLLIGDFSWYLAPWTRPVSPIIGMLVLTAYLIFAFRILTGKSERFILPGILISLSVGYFFSFVYVGVFTILLIIISWFSHRSKEEVLRFGKVLLTGGFFVGLMVGPLIWQLIIGEDIGGFNDPRRSGLFYTHLPLINKTSLLLTAMFVLFTYFIYRKWKEKIWKEDWWLLCATFLLSNQVVYNIQIILGWTVWPAHFTRYTNITICLVLIITLANVGRKYFSKTTRIIGWALVFMSTLILARTITNYDIFIPTLQKFQTYQPVYSWLDKNVGKDCVVLSVQDDYTTLQFNRFVNVYTKCDVYHSMNIYQGVPQDRIFHNVLVWLWMKGVTEKELPEFLEKENFLVRSYLFRDWVDLFCCAGDKWIAKLGSQEDLNTWYSGVKLDVEKEYRNFLFRETKKELGKYRLDYVVVDKTSRSRPDLQNILGLKEVYSDENYIIYSFIK